MVGNDNINALLQQPSNLMCSRNAIINRNDKIGLAICHNTIKSCSRQAIALIKTVRNIGAHMIGTHATKRQGEQTGGCYAIHVKIPKHRNGFIGSNGLSYLRGALLHIGNDIGIKPIPIKVRLQKVLRFRVGIKTACCHDASNQRRNVKL